MTTKNIVICSDGTGNTANKARGTNVFKIFEFVDIYSHTIDPTRKRQVTIYDDGVGTSNFKLLRLAGGAFGVGLGRNVQQLYAELARVYNPGDAIYLFGFSRGAFTVRTLAGIIATYGIVHRDKCRNDICLKAHVAEAYSLYRQRYRTLQSRHFYKWLGRPTDFRKKLEQQRAADYRKRCSVAHPTHAPEGKVTIEFIGVWDTVDAVGLPFAGLASVVNNFIYRYKFPDRRLSPQVKKACHALSIDDERLTFHPEMWDERDEEREGRIEQVWFPGVHSNVGGGYPKQGLSLVSLYWMMKKAAKAGLQFSEFDMNFAAEHQHPFDKLYDSRGSFAVYYRYEPRNIGEICQKYDVVPKIHISAVERIMQGNEGYAPGNIPANAKIVSTEPQPINLDAISAVIASGVAPDRILLDRTGLCVWVRKGCHMLLITITFVFIGLFLPFEQGREALGALFSGRIPTFFKALLALPHSVQGALSTLAVTGVVLLAVTLVARRRMRWLFSDAWYAISSTLSSALHGRDRVASDAVEAATVRARKLCENCDIPPVQRFLSCLGMGRING